MAGTKTEIDISVDKTVTGLNEIEKGASKASGSINELSKSFSKLGRTSVDMSSAKALEVIKQRIEKLVPAYNKLLVLQDKVNPLLEVEDVDNLEPTKAKNYSRKESRQNKRVSSSINEIQGLWANLDKSDRNKLFSWGQKNIYSPERNPEGNLKANPFKGVEIDPNLLLKAFIGKLDPDALYRGIYNKNSNSNKKLLSYDEYEEYEAKSKNKINEADFEILEESFADLSDAAKTVVNSFSELSKTGPSIGEKTVVENPVKETKQEDKHTYDVNGALDALLKNNSNPEYDWVYDYVKEGPKETKQEEIISEIKEIHSALTNSSTSESSGGKETNRRINGQVFKPSDLDDPILGKAIKQALAGNNAYGRNVRVAEGNLQISRNEEPFKIAKMAMQVTNKGLGGGSGNAYVNNIFKALGSQITKSFNNGFKDLNFGKLFEDAYVQRRKSKKQDSVLKKFGLENDQLFATDTLFDKEDYKEILEKTDAFRNFAEQLREDLGEAGEALSDDDIYEQFKNGKQSRQTLIENLSGNDREMLGDYVKGITANKKDRNGLLKSLSSDSKDRARLIGGIAGAGGEGAKALGSVAGKAVAPIAFIQGLGTAGKALIKFANSTIQAYEGIQKLQTQLSVVFATTTQASSTFNEIAEYAKKSPFGVEQTTQEAILLKQSGVYSSELMDTIKRIGDLSSGSAEKMKSISEVYARVMSSTTVTARDMRQLANAGVASYSALSKATGTDRSLIRAQLQSGKVTSQDFKAMVKELTDEGGMFYGATERGAKTIAARKQNLSDAKQLATSEIGRFFATFGGNTTQDSLYGKGISLLEGIFGFVEDIAKDVNDKKEANAVDKYIEKLQTKYEEKADRVAEGKSTDKIDEEIERLEGLVRSQQGMSSAAGAVIYEKSYAELVKKVGQDFEILKKEDEYGSYYTIKQNNGEEFRADEFGGNQSDIENLMKYKLDELFKKATEAGQKGADMLDAAINEIDTALDDVENTQNRLQDLSAAQTRMSSARRDWNQNSPVAQMMLKDAQAQRDDYLKQRITYFEGKTLDKETGKYDLSKLGINEFAEAAKMITTEARKLDLDMENGHIWSAEANEGRGGVSEAGVETLGILKENLEEVYATLLNDGGEDLIEKSGMKDFESLISMLGQDVSKFDKDKLEILMKLLDKVNESSEKAAETQGEKGENYRSILQAAQTETVRDTSNAKYLNKRKQAVLWAQILSQTTGLSAERVQGVGASKAMNAYTTNFAQREMFSKLGKALMSNGSSLKDLSNILKANHTGKDSYGHDLYNWQGATATAEQMAAKQSLETQGALIDAYQQQIDVLTDLEMSGIATRDQWDNLGSLAAQLGTGFSLAAEEMADGTYKFTEATIQAAEDMKNQLNARKFAQELNYIIRSAREKVQEETLGSQLTSALLNKSIPVGGVYSTEEYKRIAEVMPEVYKKAINTDTNVFQQMGLVGSDGKIKASLNLDESFDKFLDNYSKLQGKQYTYTTGTETSKISSTVALTAQDFQELLNKTKEKNSRAYAGYLERPEYKAGNKWLDIYNEEKKNREKAIKNGQNVSPLGSWDEWLNKTGLPSWEKLKKDIETSAKELGFTINKISPTELIGTKTITNTISSGTLKLFETDEQGNVKEVALKEIDTDLKKLQEQLKKGEGTDDQIVTMYNLIDDVTGTIEERFKESMTEYANAVKENTRQTNRLNKLLESSSALDKLKELNEMYLMGEDRQKAYNERDYASMPEYAPLQMGWNNSIKERSLEWLGYSKNSNWNDVLNRLSEGMVSSGVRDKLDNQELLTEEEKTSLSGYQEYLGKYMYENLNSLFGMFKNKDLKNQLKTELGAQYDEEGNFTGYGYEDLTKYIDALKQLEESGKGIDELTNGWTKQAMAIHDAAEALIEFKDVLKQSLKDASLDAITSSLKLIGEDMYKLTNEMMTQEEAAESIKKSLAGQASALLDTIGKAAIKAGLELIGAGAMSQNYAMIAAGLGLAAAGGFASIGSGLLNGYANNKDSDKSEEKINRLEALKNNLADLLKQAKADAEYYEVNLRAKQAFSTNEGVSAMKVTKTNDMILSPNGTFSTHPDDYIMAMKDPSALMGNGSPIVNFNIINNSGTNLNVERSKTTQDGNNIDIEVVVNGIVQKGMVNGEYDDAFTAMQARNEGIKTSA